MVFTSSSSRSSSIPSIYKPSPSPSRIYNSRNTKSEPQVVQTQGPVQTQSTFGEYIKQGFGTYFGWRIGTAIFGSGREEQEIPKTNTYIINSTSEKCKEYKELLSECLKNGGDWNSSDCSKFIKLLNKCENNNESTFH